MDLLVFPDGTAEWNGKRFRCALGPAGVSNGKREGDGATPAGSLALRRAFYRPDRLDAPSTVLPVTALHPLDVWCDDPNDPCYNRLVRQPYAGGFETLWRGDGLYDIVVELGYNDAPAVPGKGSAIFLHIARNDFSPTEGCVAVAREVLVRILAECDGETRVRISST